jgi:CheY-like chemotaxis protein
VAKSSQQLWLLEDSAEDAEIFTFAAESVGLPAEVRHFQAGSDLLRAAEACGAGDHPALALLDLNLPGMDGRDLIARLKQNPAFRAVPLLVLSSSASRNDVARAYEAGACAYLVKPLGIVRYEELLRSLRDFWFGNSVRPPA